MCTILLVENDFHQRMWLKQELADDGYTVLTASGGRQALDQVAVYQPDLVILDLFISDSDGFHLLSQLHEMNACLPVVIHTAYAAYRDNTLTCTADAYVIKSSDTSELKREILAALNHRNDRCQEALLRYN